MGLAPPGWPTVGISPIPWGIWAPGSPKSDLIARLSAILTATYLSHEGDGLERTLDDLSPVLPTTYLSHEVDGPWRTQGDLTADLSSFLYTSHLTHEVDGPWRPQGDRITGFPLHWCPRLLLLAHQPEFSQIKPKFIYIPSVADPDPGSLVLFDPWIRDQGSGTRDGNKSDPGSGIK